eukprot:7534887-Alexandrium_andersonii.AAC.1
MGSHANSVRLPVLWSGTALGAVVGHCSSSANSGAHAVRHALPLVATRVWICTLCGHVADHVKQCSMSLGRKLCDSCVVGWRSPMLLRTPGDGGSIMSEPIDREGCFHGRAQRP